MAISRLFTEIGKDVDRLNASLRDSMKHAEEAGYKIEASGKRMLSSFERALNPSKDLGEQIRLLEIAGKSGADIWNVYGKQMQAAAEATRKNGQAVDGAITKHLELNKTAWTSKLNFESLGAGIQDFARNPLQAARSGMESLVGSMAPAAVGFIGVATGVAVAAKALFDLGVSAAAEAEQLANLSVSTGLSTQRLQALAQIGREAGLESLDLGKTIGMLNQQLGRAEGGDFTRALVDADIALEDANGRSKDAIALLDELRARFSNIIDPVDRARAMHAALGGRLRDLIPLLMSSNESLDKQLKIMEDTGPVWDEITQRKLMAFDSALDHAGRTWKSLTTDIKAGVGGILGDLAKLEENPPGLPGQGFEAKLLLVGINKLFPKATEEEFAAITSAMQKSLSVMSAAPDTLYASAEKTVQISRELFVTQQRLITQGADHLDLRMQIAAAEQKFTELVNRGSREQVGAQALVLAGLNAQLKALQGVKEKAKEVVAAVKEIKLPGPTGMDYVLADIGAGIGNMAPPDFSGYQIPVPDEQPPPVMPIPGSSAYQSMKLSEQILADADDLKGASQDSVAYYEAYMTRVKELRDQNVIEEQEAAQLIAEARTKMYEKQLGQAYAYFDQLAALSSSRNRTLAIIGKAAAVGRATIDGFLAVQAALAHPPGPPSTIPMAAAIGVVAAANVANIISTPTGYAKGGLIRGGQQVVTVNEQGQEYVMNSQATRDYMPLLQAINNGASRGYDGPSMDFGSGGLRPELKVSIVNYGTSKAFDVEHMNEGSVRIIARDEALGVLQQRGPEIIANDMAYANSRTSKALTQNTTARRMR